MPEQKGVDIYNEKQNSIPERDGLMNANNTGLSGL